ncbi:MAG: LysM peptidoglycan-binding domain-containing protein [Anaerolineales bacterium]|nr:LysM peptidoglycan-binding domain-containing protein [Anaerolineales bacterium]MCS7248268.1 LysM peptidoglycan-binding domain-containing protein [Anaerolineales bacterium]MDW8162082.1 LysM peptidoglycan-binding domain-containing protein [Anaerolineales bacterium]MDW8446228.1 LysM peptidoglycan-binding domain-containing protein [Anaerolineales bacterium]
MDFPNFRTPLAWAVRGGILLGVAAILVVNLPTPAQAAACALKYTVQSGDTLYGIAAKFQVKFEELVEVNKLKPPYLLAVGQVLCIPKGAVIPTNTPAPTPAPGTPAAKNLPSISGFHLGDIAWIALTNFPKERFVYIKAYEGRKYYWMNPNHQLAIVRTDKKGQFGAYFHMPTDLEDERVITVCAKDALNDDVIACQVLINPDYDLYRPRWAQ